MSLVPVSQVSLMRKRRELKQLMQEGRWDEVIRLEAELFAEIDAAAQDPARSAKDLLKELGSVIRVYRELSELCNRYSKSSQYRQQ